MLHLHEYEYTSSFTASLYRLRRYRYLKGVPYLQTLSKLNLDNKLERLKSNEIDLSGKSVDRP